MSGHKGGGGNRVGCQGAATVKTEPAEPEQAGSKHGHGQVMGHITVLPKTPAGTDDQDSRQRCSTAGYMYHQAACKIQNRHIKGGHPTAAPYPVADRVVDQYGPQQTENRKGGKSYPLGKGSGDQGRSNDCKHALVNHEHGLGNRGSIIATWCIGYTF